MEFSAIFPIASLQVLRIHSERDCLPALATFSKAVASLLDSQIGTILPLACPFGSAGQPKFLRFFWLIVPNEDYKSK